MKLKTEKTEQKKNNAFDKKAKLIFIEESKFIHDVFSRTALPVHNSTFDDDLVTYNKNKDENSAVPKKSRAETFEELQSRLEQLRGAKGLQYKDKMEKKNLKNKLKKKAKQKEAHMKKMLAATERNAAGGSSNNKSEPDDEKVPKNKPVFNSAGHMVFSKFDFKELGNKKRLPKVEKDPKKILEQLKEKKQKIRELEESGEQERAKEIKEKEAWKTALAKAQGEKIKDDPELLKKSIKRVEKQKERSAKKWQARKEGVENDMQKRQQKRQENIAARKKQKKTNKLKKSAKKGRVIPGF